MSAFLLETKKEKQCLERRSIILQWGGERGHGVWCPCRLSQSGFFPLTHSGTLGTRLLLSETQFDRIQVEIIQYRPQMMAQGIKWWTHGKNWSPCLAHDKNLFYYLPTATKLLLFKCSEKQEGHSYDTFTPNSLKTYGWFTLKRKSKGEGNPKVEIRDKA